MKKRVSNNILSVLIIFFIIASFLSTLVIIYYSDSLATGKAAAEGTVGVTVGTAPSTPGPSGGGGGGGGGGGTASMRTPIIHILDFRIKEIYSVEAFYGDFLVTIFTDTKNYTFKIERVVQNKETELSIGITKILIPTDEIVSLDLDRDGNNDLDTEFDGTNITMKLVRIPKAEATNPIIER